MNARSITEAIENKKGELERIFKAFSTETLNDANATKRTTITGRRASELLRPTGLQDERLSKIWREGTKGTGEICDVDRLRELFVLVKRELYEVGENRTKLPESYSSSSAQSQSIEGKNDDQNKMTDREREKYEKHFHALDMSKSGMVSVDQAAKFLSKASLSEREIREIVRRRSRGATQLTSDAFSLAMHDVYAVIKGKGSGAHGVTPMMGVGGGTTFAATPSTAGVLNAQFASLNTPMNYNNNNNNNLLLQSSKNNNNNTSSLLVSVDTPETYSRPPLDLGFSMDNAAITTPAVDPREQAKLDKEMMLYENKISQSEQRNQRARDAIESTRLKVEKMREAAERAEKNAEDAKKEAQNIIEDAEKKRAEYRTRAMTAKDRAQEQIYEKENQMQLANRELEKLRQKVEQAESVSILPLKAMESKLRTLQLEVTRVKEASKNRQEALSAELVKKGTEIREMERVKAAAEREAESIERQFQEKREQSEQALERGKQALGAAKNQTINAEKQHFKRVEQVREALVEAKKEFVKEKESLAVAKKKHDIEFAKLEEERVAASQEVENQRLITRKAKDANRLQIQNKRVMLDEASDALKDAKKQRDIIEEEHKNALNTANENFSRIEVRLNAEKAKLKQKEEKNKAALEDIEDKIVKTESYTEEIVRKIENADRDLEKRRNDLETRLEVATESLEAIQEELRSTKLRVDAQREELDLREQACEEKEAEAENAAESSKSLIKSMEEDVQELRAKIESEEKRINEETAAVQHDLEQKRAYLELETTRLEAALERAKDNIPRESAAAQQAYALEAMIATTESAREEAEQLAEESEIKAEKNMARLMELAELVGNANMELNSSSQFTESARARTTFKTTSNDAFDFNRTSSFNESSTTAVAKSATTKDNIFDKHVGVNDFDSPEPFTGGFAEAENAFSPQIIKTSSSVNAFASSSFNDEQGDVFGDDFGGEFDSFAKPESSSQQQPAVLAVKKDILVDDEEDDDPFDVDFDAGKVNESLRLEAKQDDEFFEDFGDDGAFDVAPNNTNSNESVKENDWFEDGMNNTGIGARQDDAEDDIFNSEIVSARKPSDEDLAFEEEDFFAPISQKPVQSFEDFNSSVSEKKQSGFDSSDNLFQQGNFIQKGGEEEEDAFNDEFSGDFNSKEDGNDGFDDDFGDFETTTRQSSIDATNSYTNKALATSNALNDTKNDAETTFEDEATDEDENFAGSVNEPQQQQRQQQQQRVPSEITEDFEENESLDQIPARVHPDDLERSKKAWYTLKHALNDPAAVGVTGAQVAAMASKTGLPNDKLAVMWNASCTSDGSSLGLGDFCVFMHLLKNTLNGGSLPDFRIEGSFREEMIGSDVLNEENMLVNQTRARFLTQKNEQPAAEERQEPASVPPPLHIQTPPPAEQQQQRGGGSSPRRSQHQESSPTLARTSANVSNDDGVGQPQRLKVFIDSVANVKDASKMQQVHCKVSLVDTNGQELERPQNTAVGARPGNDASSLTIQNAVTLSSAPATWPAGSAVLIELRHFKKKDNKVSTRCWSFMEKESVRPGLFGLPLAKKPADPLRQKVSLFNKGTPDLKLRFSFV